MSEGSIYYFFGEKAGILDYVLVGLQEELLTDEKEDQGQIGQYMRENILRYRLG